MIKNIKITRLNEGADDYDDDDFDEFEYAEEDEQDFENDANHLCYLIRGMFKNSKIETQVEMDPEYGDITIYVFLNKVEKMSKLLQAFDVVHKIKTDIMPYYDSEFELYESTAGQPILSFQFFENNNDVDYNHVKKEEKDKPINYSGRSSIYDDDSLPF